MVSRTTGRNPVEAKNKVTNSMKTKPDRKVVRTVPCAESDAQWTPVPHRGLCGLLGVLLVAATARAGPRSSTSYYIATDTTDNGGRRATSTAYTNDGSMGMVAGISTVASPAETAKSGYIGQLYDVPGLTLTAASLNVNEGATDQLGAWQTLDAATFLAIPATSVAWSVVSGPIGISVAGVATAGSVYQNTPATAQGSYAGNTGILGLTVVNVNDDNYREYAGDGIGDSWQVQYFGQPPNATAGPTMDITGAGQNNLFKYIAGLNPTDRSASNAVFTLAIQPVPGQPTQESLIFPPIFAGRTYTLKSKPELDSATWSTGSASGLTISSGTVGTITDLSATGAKKFYHIEITKQ